MEEYDGTTFKLEESLEEYAGTAGKVEEKLVAYDGTSGKSQRRDWWNMMEQQIICRRV